jgi:hypothetical protein
MPTFDKIPIPSQIMTSGRRATRGVAFIAFTTDSLRHEFLPGNAQCDLVFASEPSYDDFKHQAKLRREARGPKNVSG